MSSCQKRVHLKRSARGLSGGRSMKVMRVWETLSYILTPWLLRSQAVSFIDESRTHQIVGPRNKSTPPSCLPDRAFAGMENSFFVSKPTLLA